MRELTRTHFRMLLAAAVLVAATAAWAVPYAAGAARPPRRQLGGESLAAERWILPQIVAPGARPVVSGGGREDPNRCSFPYRISAYHAQSTKRLPDGDLDIHIIRVITYQNLDASNTIFETDNFTVTVNHLHPKRDWKITGRYGDWHLNQKLAWLDQGILTGTPTAHGIVVRNLHPGRLSTQPSLCAELTS